MLHPVTIPCLQIVRWGEFRCCHQVSHVDVRVLPSPEAMVAVIVAIRSHQPGSRMYQVMTAIAYYAGLRPSEAVMLRPRAGADVLGGEPVGFYGGGGGVADVAALGVCSCDVDEKPGLAFGGEAGGVNKY